MKSDNIVLEKSYLFSLRIVKLYLHLQKEKKEYHLSAQIVKSGTSVGANIEEAIGASSKKDFIAKLDIAHKESRETRFWLKLLRDSSFIETKPANSLIGDCEELIKLLTTILKSSKASIHKN
jgi:four helix bundle protein